LTPIGFTHLHKFWLTTLFTVGLVGLLGFVLFEIRAVRALSRLSDSDLDEPHFFDSLV
jgi:O-antigen ligase